MGEGGQSEARLSGVKAEIGREDKSNNDVDVVVDDDNDERVLLLLLLLLAIEDADAEEEEEEGEDGDEGVPITMFEVASVVVEVILSDPKTALTMLLITPNTPPVLELTLKE